MTVANATDLYSVARWIVDPTSGSGTHTTIQSAINSASSGDVIFIRPGTYTENLTAKAGVRIVAFNDPTTVTATPVTIKGKCTLTSGTISFTDIHFTTNSDYMFDVSGSSTINFYTCGFITSGHAGFLGASAARLNFYYCRGSDSGAGSENMFAVLDTIVFMIGCYFSGGTTTGNTFGNTGSFTVLSSTFQQFFTTAGTVIFTASNSQLGGGNHVAATIGATNGTDSANDCSFSGGTQSAISVSTGSTLTVSDCTISSSNTNAITGAGTINYGGLVYTGSSSTVNTSTATPLVTGPTVKETNLILTGVSAHNILIGEGTSVVTGAAPGATSGVPLISQGASSDPVFGTATVPGGGTGAVTLTGVLIGNGTSAVTGNAVTQHDVLVGGASNAITSVAPSATSGVPLISQGASSDPAFGTAVVAGGGTGAVTLTGVLTGNGTSAITANTVTQHGVLLGGATNAVSSLGVAATGTVLAGATGADPAFTATPTLTSVTFGSGTALSSYVEGTWTPTIVGGTTPGTTSYTAQNGWYRRIGSIVFFALTVKGTTGNTAAGALVVGGLPITVGSGNSVNFQSHAVEVDGNLTLGAGYTVLFAQAQSGTSQFNMMAYGSAKASSALSVVSSTDYNFQFTGFYSAT